MQPTQRTYTDTETGGIYRLYTDKDNSIFKIITEGDEDHAKGSHEVNGWYLTNFNLLLKINNKKVVELKANEFYNLKEGEIVTHTKNPLQKCFVKLKV